MTEHRHIPVTIDRKNENIFDNHIANLIGKKVVISKVDRPFFGTCVALSDRYALIENHQDGEKYILSTDGVYIVEQHND